MWIPDIAWWQLVLRGVVVYTFLMLLLRATGKRQVGQLAPFDLVLLLVLSNAVQNSMNGGDTSLTGGLIAAATLVALDYLLGLVTHRSKKLESIVEGRPQVLIHNGRLDEAVMTNAHLTRHEVNAALRQSGCASLVNVHMAMLENNGAISVIPHKPGIEKSEKPAAEPERCR